CGAQVMELTGASANGHRGGAHPLDSLVAAGEPGHGDPRSEPVSRGAGAGEEISPIEDLGRPVQTGS
ncbi:MAG TPA: hypothetical protein VNU24_03005, partial [Solirubrobacteraceae bacterium]|nr:hypothetical protein [Solirubrobacteraceae bacterium]